MKCIICGSAASKIYLKGHEYMFGIPGIHVIKKCVCCGMVFLDPQPTKKELQKYYPSTDYYSYKSVNKQSFFAWLRNYLVIESSRPSFIGKIVSLFLSVPAIPVYTSKGKVLDIGCGSGHTLMLLKKVGWDVYGLDIDDRAIKVAHKNGLKNVSLGSFESMKKYPDGFFDCIRLYHVIEHLDKPDVFMQLAWKKLKKGGALIIGTPNIDSAIARVGRRYWYNLDCPRHVCLFSPKTLRTLIEKNKFIFEKTAFCSAGGIVGTIQYFLNEHLNNRIDLINSVFLILLFYPLERLLDILQLGDVFVITARK
jgi:2-polyprenyl-3-methyl-5-hydroxy-6-metoxy-1,4-benzoquinol methylase